jgi:hypothetical protein
MRIAGLDVASLVTKHCLSICAVTIFLDPIVSHPARSEDKLSLIYHLLYFSPHVGVLIRNPCKGRKGTFHYRYDPGDHRRHIISTLETQPPRRSPLPAIGQSLAGNSRWTPITLHCCEHIGLLMTNGLSHCLGFGRGFLACVRFHGVRRGRTIERRQIGDDPVQCLGQDRDLLGGQPC